MSPCSHAEDDQFDVIPTGLKTNLHGSRFSHWKMKVNAVITNGCCQFAGTLHRLMVARSVTMTRGRSDRCGRACAGTRLSIARLSD
jgi:hypothetical protein